jgi:hypothetical protein
MNSNEPPIPDYEPLDGKHTLTVDEAVLKFFGMQCDMEHYYQGEVYEISLADVMENNQEDASTDLHNAKVDLEMLKRENNDTPTRIDEAQKKILECELKKDKARKLNSNAGELSRRLKSEASKSRLGQSSILVVDPILSDREGRYHITIESLDAFYEVLQAELSEALPYRVSKNNSYNQVTDTTPRAISSQINWEDVTIKIYKDLRLGYSHERGNYRTISFREVGLMGKRENDVNALGKLLIDLAQFEGVHSGKATNNKLSSRISKLGRILKDCIGISKPPFKKFNSTDGYVPRFKLINDQSNAENRAAKEGKFTSDSQTCENIPSSNPGPSDLLDHSMGLEDIDYPLENDDDDFEGSQDDDEPQHLDFDRH